MNQDRNIYKNKLKTVAGLTHDRFYFYWKGRVALTAILKAINLQEGDEVILPAFTCVVVPNAIIYLKATPIYVDINLETYNTDLEKIKQKVTAKTKAIICQNTFGLSSEVEKISSWCKANNIISIEDCTHGYGGFYQGKPNGSYSDFAFYSSQWNKPFSTGIGGFLLVNNLDYIEKVEKVNKLLLSPGFKERLLMKLLLFARKHILTQANYWTLLKQYRYLSKKNLVVGSSSNEEITSIKQPDKYFMNLANVQIKEGNKALDKLEGVMKLRKENAILYSDFLKKNGKKNVADELFEDHSFLKYPLLVLERDHFLTLAEKAKIDFGEWFNSPIHPVQNSLEMWQLNMENFPNADYASQRIVNLPADTNDMKRVLTFLEANLDLII